MRKITSYTLIIAGMAAICVLTFSACSDDSTLDMLGMFSNNGEPVQTRFAQSKAYNDSVGEIHLNMGSDNYRIYICTDSHITRKNHQNLDHFMTQYKAETSPKLALHLGDLIDAQKNLPCADSIVHFAGQTIKDTLFITPGNHDVYFKQWSIYRSFFKTGTYWFDTNNGTKKLDLFICLDSADGTLGKSQTNWLKDLLEAKSQDNYRRIIIFTHTHIWKLDDSQGHTSNMAMEETYELTSLLSRYGVAYVWCGHQHARQDVTYKGVRYMVLDATKDTEKGQSYMVADMSDKVNYHYINYPPVK